ncbi:MAG: SLBB domain-containing protein [Gemmatimonadota bacterium]|jgi:polysaccharide export outer membrane protein|nr:SLBB domain-containing protein [Gemmatimonadota bacterium]
MLPGLLLGQTRLGTAAEKVTLQPGDLVRAQIWREGDLSGDFLVDQNGIVTLPLLGEQRVTGIPIGELRTVLLQQYRVELRNPSINITPLRRLNVLGEVTKPGLYPVDPTISLVEVVAQAGGATESGDLRRIRIVRGGEVIREGIRPGETLSTLDIRSGDQILVERRTWLDRNSTSLATALLSIVGGLVTTLIIVANT